MNFFTYFGLDLALNVDKSVLRKAFYAKSREVHPDQQGDTEQQAAINNEAFRVLSDDDTRIRHILELHGVVSLDHEKLPQEFLVAMMDINEAIMEAETEEDATQLLKSVDVFEAEMQESIAHLQQDWPKNEEQLSEALKLLKDYAIKKRYLLRIRENLSKFAAS